MIIIGLTGSIGMGKSFTANQWRSLGVPVFDADKAVHDLYHNKKIIQEIAENFPESGNEDGIDRKKLGTIIFNDKNKRDILENILHPLVRQARNTFIQQCRHQRQKICVLDIPLLFEAGIHKDTDLTVCVYAPQWIQARRVLSRPDMTYNKMKAIAKSQMPDYRKKSLSDITINTGRGERHSLQCLKKLKEDLLRNT